MDAVSLLTLYLVLTFAIPAKLVIGPLGGAGSPAQVLGLLMAIWWVLQRMTAGEPATRIRQPVRIAMLLFVGSVLVSYVAATVRPIDAVELRAADRGLLIVISWLGVCFVAMDGIASLERLDGLMRRLSLGGGLLATLGIVQFFTHQELVDRIHIIGLSDNGGAAALMSTQGLARPAGTALHPIEFGVVLTLILPIALHYALEDRVASRARRWYPAAAIACAVPLSISRSAILGTVVGLAVLLCTVTCAIAAADLTSRTWPSARSRRASGPTE